MKKLLWGVMAVALAVPVASFAAELRLGENPSVATQERILDDIYIVGGSVTSAGTVAGDVVAGGGTVIINGTVEADVIAGGGNVSILSSVGDDVRVGGGSVVVLGRVGGDIVAGGGQVTIGGPGIGGDAILGGGMVRIDAPIAGAVRIGGGSVYLNAPITGDVLIEADTLTLGSQAVINGSLTYKAKKELVKEEGAIVNEEVTFEPRRQRAAPAAAAAILSAFALGKFLALLAAALVIGLIFKRYGRELASKIVQRPLLELGRGLVVFVALPMFSILALVTLVGIPLGILGLISFVVAILFAWIVTPIVVGSIAYSYFSKDDFEISWRTIGTGVVLFSILGLVPLVGWLAQALLVLLSLGAIAAVTWGVIKQWR